MVWDDRKMTVVLGKTRVVSIIGDPIRHSLSPLMQNAAFAASGLDYIYVPFAVTPQNLERAVHGMKALGVFGCNVTIPHKTAIIPFLDRLDATAEASGAVNTVLFSETGLIGYNTDGDGLIDSLANDLGFSPGAEQILVIGAGGATRGAVAALCRSGAMKITLCNRSVQNARSVMLDMKARFPGTTIDVTGQYQVTAATAAATSLLLNTTSLGMNGERIDCLNIADLPEHAKVYDMVYSNSGTPLVTEASQAGLRVANGLGMLVAQGELAFEIWTGQKPPEGVMRKALGRI
jgi:shikimate dehydrogenase